MPDLALRRDHLPQLALVRDHLPDLALLRDHVPLLHDHLSRLALLRYHLSSLALLSNHLSCLALLHDHLALLRDHLSSLSLLRNHLALLCNHLSSLALVCNHLALLMRDHLSPLALSEHLSLPVRHLLVQGLSLVGKGLPDTRRSGSGLRVLQSSVMPLLNHDLTLLLLNHDLTLLALNHDLTLLPALLHQQRTLPHPCALLPDHPLLDQPVPGQLPGLDDVPLLRRKHLTGRLHDDRLLTGSGRRLTGLLDKARSELTGGASLLQQHRVRLDDDLALGHPPGLRDEESLEDGLLKRSLLLLLLLLGDQLGPLDDDVPRGGRGHELVQLGRVAGGGVDRR